MKQQGNKEKIVMRLKSPDGRILVVYDVIYDSLYLWDYVITGWEGERRKTKNKIIYSDDFEKYGRYAVPVFKKCGVIYSVYDSI